MSFPSKPGFLLGFSQLTTQYPYIYQNLRITFLALTLIILSFLSHNYLNILLFSPSLPLPPKSSRFVLSLMKYPAGWSAHIHPGLLTIPTPHCNQSDLTKT